MKCPFCNHMDTQVVETRMGEEGAFIRRRRQCLSCAKRFTTYEFSHDKLQASFVLALRKRPVASAEVDAAIDHVEEKLLNAGVREVASSHIGELVMHELRKLDKVAYIRFASVYRSFEDIDDFKHLVDEVRT